VGIPGPALAIVMKLLAKPRRNATRQPQARSRFSTVPGGMGDDGRIEPFSLGGCDVSDRPADPEKLYGRERGSRRCWLPSNRVVANGTLELSTGCRGYFPIGKTCGPVNELAQGASCRSVACSRPASSTSTSATSRTPPWPSLPDPRPLAFSRKATRSLPVAGLAARGAGPEWSDHGQSRSRSWSSLSENSRRSRSCRRRTLRTASRWCSGASSGVRAQGEPARPVP